MEEKALPKEEMSSFVRQVKRDLIILENHVKNAYLFYSTRDRRVKGILAIKKELQQAIATGNDIFLYKTIELLADVCTGTFINNDSYRMCLKKTLKKVKENKIVLQRRSIQTAFSTGFVNGHYEVEKKEESYALLKQLKEALSKEVDVLQEKESQLMQEKQRVEKDLTASNRVVFEVFHSLSRQKKLSLLSESTIDKAYNVVAKYIENKPLPFKTGERKSFSPSVLVNQVSHTNNIYIQPICDDAPSINFKDKNAIPLLPLKSKTAKKIIQIPSNTPKQKIDP